MSLFDIHDLIPFVLGIRGSVSLAKMTCKFHFVTIDCSLDDMQLYFTSVFIHKTQNVMWCGQFFYHVLNVYSCVIKFTSYEYIRGITTTGQSSDIAPTPFGFCFARASRLQTPPNLQWPYSLSAICMLLFAAKQPSKGHCIFLSLCLNTHCVQQQIVKPATALGTSWQPRPPPTFQNKQLLWSDCILSTGTEIYILCL